MPHTLRLFVTALGLAGCGVVTHETRSIPTGSGTAVVAAPDSPSVGAEWVYADGILRGTVQPLATCHRAEIQYFHDQEVAVRASGVGDWLAVGAGVAIAAASIWLIDKADTFSDTETCTTDAEGESCSSERENAYVLGGVGTALGIGLSAAVLYGIVTGPSETVEGEADREAIVTRHPEPVPCHAGPIDGLGLAVMRVDQVVARSTTNDQGEVAFAIPRDITGALTVVIDAVPEGLTALAEPKTVVGRVQIEP